MPSSPRWCFREVVTDRRLTHQASSDVAIATDDDTAGPAPGSEQLRPEPKTSRLAARSEIYPVLAGLRSSRNSAGEALIDDPVKPVPLANPADALQQKRSGETTPLVSVRIVIKRS